MIRSLLSLALILSISGEIHAQTKTPAVKKAAAEKAKKKAGKTWNWRNGVPQLGCVYPAGGRQGDIIEIAVSGQRLRGVNKVSVSGDGIEVLSVNYIPRVNPRYIKRVRYDFGLMLSEKYNLRKPKKPKLSEKQKKEFAEDKIPDNVLLKDFDKMTRRYLELAAANIYVRHNSLQSAPALRENLIIKLKIAKDAAPGMRELRMWDDARWLSNPLRFYVGELPEVTEERLFGPTADLKTEVKLPAVLNGQVMPGEIDSFVFKAQKGQILTFAVMARQIIPYLGDAVPGWFQPVISIHDEKGNELKFEDDFYCSPDPVMCFKVPADGKYELRIRDSIYRGRKDFVYRIKAGEFPFISGVFPLGVQAGVKSKVTLKGYNMDDRTLELTVPADAYDSYVIPGVGDPSFNRVRLAVDSLPGIFDKEKSGDPAREVKVDVIVNGRIDHPGDTDKFKIKGRAGETLVFDVNARKLGSPLDACLALCDNKGKVLLTADDNKEPNIGFNTHKADPYMMFKVPADDDYYLTLRDIQNHGGEAYAYRLRISRPRPDFRVYCGVPSLNIRRWQTIKEPVRIVRIDGFKGTVKLREDSEKPVFKIVSGVVRKDEGTFEFQLADRRKGEIEPPFPVNIVGKAEIDGKTVKRKMVPCENMMQAFIYYHWTPFNTLLAFPNRR
jgi:hypothetical protein